MDRRNAIRNLVIATGGLITLPAWMGCGTGDAPGTHQSSFSVDEQKLLAAVADTIIPAGGSIGALSMGVDKFLQKLFDDCYEKEVGDNIKTQLAQLDKLAAASYDDGFHLITQPRRQELLAKFAASPSKPEKDFFTLVRTETIRGFNTSKEVMEKYLDYKVAPGHYYGCIDVKA